jgi:D-methionine transport system ATP-binding protein
MIRIHNLVKIYHSQSGRVEALKGIDLNVQAGEIFGVVGYSGAGKSSLIRCVNLLEKPTSGQVWVGSQELTKLNGTELRFARKKIGMIFQHFNLLTSQTVFYNIAVPLYLSGVKKSEAQRRVNELLRLVNLSDKADVFPNQLSGGQKQRVAIARALATNPEVLLCDEATSALDPQTTDSILQLLKEINRKLGITILLITHEMNVIKEICDKVAVMEDGRIIEQGSVLDLFSKPKTATAKAFTKTVMGDSIPDDLFSTDYQGQLVRITFLGENATRPHLSDLAKKLSVSANIIHGHVTKIKDTPFGSLVVELLGENDAVKAGIQYLNNQGLETEVLYRELAGNCSPVVAVS